jgi:predicted enzyme related to lactoylglutathione lyase
VAIKGLDLAWIVVNDLKKSVHFYTQIVGLKLENLDEKYGWAELSGASGGAKLGIALANDKDSIKPGHNAVVTLTVENLKETVKGLVKKGATVIGEILEVPGHVKLQMVKDHDGNHFQLVEKLGA